MPSVPESDSNNLFPDRIVCPSHCQLDARLDRTPAVFFDVRNTALRKTVEKNKERHCIIRKMAFIDKLLQITEKLEIAI